MNKIIKLLNVCYRIDEEKFVKNLNLEFNSGENVLITCSDNTISNLMIDLIVGFIKPQNGTIYAQPLNQNRYFIGYNNFESVLKQGAKVQDIINTLVSSQKKLIGDIDEINELISFFKLDKLLEQTTNNLNDDQLFLLNLAMLLIVKPRVIVLKRLPLIGNENFKIATLKYLSNYTKKNDISLISNVNDEIVIKNLVDRELKIENGKVVADVSIIEVPNYHNNDVNNKTNEFNLENNLKNALNDSFTNNHFINTNSIDKTNDFSGDIHTQDFNFTKKFEFEIPLKNKQNAITKIGFDEHLGNNENDTKLEPVNYVLIHTNIIDDLNKAKNTEFSSFNTTEIFNDTIELETKFNNENNTNKLDNKTNLFQFEATISKNQDQTLIKLEDIIPLKKNCTKIDDNNASINSSTTLLNTGNYSNIEYTQESESIETSLITNNTLDINNVTNKLDYKHEDSGNQNLDLNNEMMTKRLTQIDQEFSNLFINNASTNKLQDYDAKTTNLINNRITEILDFKNELDTRINDPEFSNLPINVQSQILDNLERTNHILNNENICVTSKLNNNESLTKTIINEELNEVSNLKYKPTCEIDVSNEFVEHITRELHVELANIDNELAEYEEQKPSSLYELWKRKKEAKSKTKNINNELIIEQEIQYEIDDFTNSLNKKNKANNIKYKINHEEVIKILKQEKIDLGTFNDSIINLSLTLEQTIQSKPKQISLNIEDNTINQSTKPMIQENVVENKPKKMPWKIRQSNIEKLYQEALNDLNIVEEQKNKK